MFVSPRTPADRTPKPVWVYRDGMDVLDSSVMPDVLEELRAYDPDAVTAEQVEAALAAPEIGSAAFAALLSPAAVPFLDRIAERAAQVRRTHHGDDVTIYTPLYLANYCSNDCTYCGFGASNRIRRSRLTPDEVRAECEAIAAMGLRQVLLVTGESPARSGVEFIAEAISIASEYFEHVGVEVQPLNVDQYETLRAAGAASVCVYQETYDADAYGGYHVFGPKRVYPYRFDSQERAIAAGIGEVRFGALLGLADFRTDAFAAGLHARAVGAAHPGVKIGLSVPRLCPTGSNAQLESGISETDLLQVMLAYRLFLPEAELALSSREVAAFRDQGAALAATELSAGDSVAVGGHADESRADGQFELADGRTVAELAADLRARGLQVVYS